MSKPPTDAAHVRALRRAALIASALACLPGTSAAESARVAHTLVIGEMVTSASGEGLDSGSSGTVHEHFPRAPVVSFRTRLAGGIAEPPASDAAGNLIVAHAEPRVSKLSPEGHELWSQRLEAEPAAPPIITRNGTIAIITQKGDSVALTETGAELATHPLPLSDPRRRARAIPLAHGGLAVASGSEIVELGATGEVLRQGHAKSTVVALVQSGASLLAVADSGGISEARPSGDFELIGRFGGAVTEGAAERNGVLVAIVDGHKLVAFELASHATRVLASDFAVSWSGAPIAFERGGFALVADGGFVSTYAASGAELARVSLLENRGFDPTLRSLRPARLVGDSESAIIAVRPASDAFLLAADGHAQRLEDTACLDPFRPTPTAHGLALSCRSGQLFMVSDKAP